MERPTTPTNPPGPTPLQASLRVCLYTCIGAILLSSLVTVAAALPTAAFSYSPTEGDAPLTVEFTDKSTTTGDPYYLWNFGDGWTSTVQNPTHTFVNPGKYTVILEITDSEGSDQKSYEVYVTEPSGPTASFYAEPTSGGAPLTVQFTDTSSGSPTTWQWEFGDGYAAPGRYPAHTYTEAGTYTVILTAYNDYGSDSTTRSNYITVGSGLVGSATVSGTVYDTVTKATIEDATVTISNTTWSNTTPTSGGGYYKFENLIPGPYSVQATKTGYATSISYAVQAYPDTVVTQDIAMSGSGVALVGTCYDAQTGAPLSNVTVTATQGSSSVTNSSTAAGAYTFDNFLTSSSITISASCSGYTHSAITVSPAAEGAVTRNLYLIPDTISHNGPAIAGLVLAASTDQAIQGATVTATVGGSSNHTALSTATGFYLIDNLTATQWGVRATATNYASSQTYTHTLENATLAFQNIKMDAEDETTSSIVYTPKQVRFTFISGKTGAPLSGLTVAATGMSTTAGTWDWFKSLLGLDVSKTNFHSATMDGVTGSDGSITFMMLESVYYSINVSNTALGVSMLTNLYPKEDEYVFTIWPDTPDTEARVTWEFDTFDVDDTHTRLEISYRDGGSRTKSFRFYVHDENQTLLHSSTTADDSSIDASYTIENVPGAVVIWGFEATLNNTVAGGPDEQIQDNQFIRFPEPGKFDFGLPDTVRYWLGFLFLVCIGAMFGYMSMKFAGPTVGIFALGLKMIDWLPIGWEVATIVFMLGCLSYIRYSKDDAGV